MSDHDLMVRILVVIGMILQLIGLLILGLMLRESRRFTRELEGWLDPGMAERGAKAFEELHANVSLMREVEERLNAMMAEHDAKAFEEFYANVWRRRSDR